MLAEQETRTHFARRLEAFCDIVFGLSLSQLAFGLGLPVRASQLLGEPLRYVFFFGTFSVICGLWIMHHRMFRYFDPAPVDVFLNFAFLAFVALIPFAMNVNLHFANERAGLAIYAACFLGTSLPLGLLQLRGLRRTAAELDPATQLKVYRGVVRSGVLSVAMLLAIAMLPFGLVFGTGPLYLIPLGMFYARRMVHAVPAGLLAPLPAPAGEAGETP